MLTPSSQYVLTIHLIILLTMKNVTLVAAIMMIIICDGAVVAFCSYHVPTIGRSRSLQQPNTSCAQKASSILVSMYNM